MAETDVFSEEEVENLKNFFSLYSKGGETANVQEMIDNLEQMEEFNTNIIMKVLRFVKKKNKTYSKSKKTSPSTTSYLTCECSCCHSPTQRTGRSSSN